MFELSKSIARRLRDPNFLSRYFVGRGIDVGCGDDWLGLYAELFPLMGHVLPYDQTIDQAQDATALAGFDEQTFDFVHSSHCLEHVVDPVATLVRWLQVVKPGGHVVVLIPDEDMYERGIWPSGGNSDHKNTFTVLKAKSWCKQSWNVVDLLEEALMSVPFDVLKVEALTQTYRYELGLVDDQGAPIDQTVTPVGECAIEFVLRRWTERDILNHGRLVASAKGTGA